MCMERKMIKAKNITKKYEDETIFQGLEFEAKEGELCIIKGKSGSGKTTLLNILSTIDSNFSGELIINNTTINNLNEEQKADFRAENIGFIFQSFALIPEFSIIQNCAIPLMMLKTPKTEAYEKAKKHLQKLILEAKDEEFLQKIPDKLSGGQQQRVAIARALIHNPKIIIADEPTANLDSKSALTIKQLLKELSKNRAVIVVTHDDDYLNYADSVYQFSHFGKNNIKSILSKTR